MINTTVTALAAAGAILALANGARAQVSGDGFQDELRRIRQEPRFQAGLGVSLRIDDRSRYRYVPSASARFYYFFHPMLAVKAGLMYDNRTELDGATDYQTLAFEVGLRVNARETNVIPFLETGFWFPSYWGSRYGLDYRDFQPGLRFAIGLSLAASDRVAFDLCLSQVLNRLNSYQEAVLEPVPNATAPCPLGMICYPYGRYPEGAYNATRFELVARVGL